MISLSFIPSIKRPQLGSFLTFMIESLLRTKVDRASLTRIECGLGNLGAIVVDDLEGHITAGRYRKSNALAGTAWNGVIVQVELDALIPGIGADGNGHNQALAVVEGRDVIGAGGCGKGSRSGGGGGQGQGEDGTGQITHDVLQMF